MNIKEIDLPTGHFKPGELLTHADGKYIHVTITYNISGKRDVVDDQIELAMKVDSDLIKIEEVNTTLYWQLILKNLEDLEDSEEKLKNIEMRAKKDLKDKLKEIFVGDKNLGNTIINAFCMVGNLRAFAFEITS